MGRSHSPMEDIAMQDVHTEVGEDFEDPFAYSGIKYAENKDLAEKKTAFEIIRVERVHKVFTKDGFTEEVDQWETTIRTLSDDEEFIVSLTCNEQRDENMTAALTALERGKKLTDYRLVKSGRAYYFKRAADCKD
jgi:hypothetical protein